MASLRAGIEYNAPKLPLQHVPTDRVLQRWAVGHGSGLPPTSDELDLLADAAQETDTFTTRASLPPRLDDATQVVIDRIVGPHPRLPPPRGCAPFEIRSFVWEWYCSPTPLTVMAAVLGIDSAKLHDIHEAVLDDLRARFQASGHADLVKLLTQRD